MKYIIGLIFLALSTNIYADQVLPGYLVILDSNDVMACTDVTPQGEVLCWPLEGRPEVCRAITTPGDPLLCNVIEAKE